MRNGSAEHAFISDVLLQEKGTDGRTAETRKQKNSNRPASIYVEDWPKLGDAVKAKTIVDWDKESANREECRNTQNITGIVTDKDETKEFNTLIAELLKTY